MIISEEGNGDRSQFNHPSAGVGTQFSRSFTEPCERAHKNESGAVVGEGIEIQYRSTEFHTMEIIELTCLRWPG